MFQSKDLTEEQVEALRRWTAEGDQLADLQRKLKEDYSLNVTYMDMRFVVLDLGLEIQSQEEEQPEEAEGAVENEAGGPPKMDPQAMGGTVSVSVDQIATPGAMVSGQVTFSDGERGRWMIDQMGRPSLDPETMGYQPTHEDLVSFQGELRKALEGESGMGL
ncbi:hypothetical protein [Roseibacillus ishigakijimensis]|uniref:Uncharacterized protein n=1 Tax=Roseibacillus ishigakijimensis TaxID=454146 RepID=A0A934VML1_9BACT|nr:hypothetical protein [Roseibacillus ishigakijimensis]MBK1834065.1 hypothetical protein [Roseibacillus ishigakijimensis]